MSEHLRRTRIIATLGPATDAPGMLKQVLAEGVDVVRLNFSHGKADDHRKRAADARAAAAELGREVAILGDLQGPKIRVEKFADGAVHLDVGAAFTQATLNNNFKSLATKLNEVLAALEASSVTT